MRGPGDIVLAKRNQTVVLIAYDARSALTATTTGLVGMTEKSAHQLHTKYRPDIDGLRAIAVLSVLGFHAFPWRMPGGFIGVDIFFVISGYLISTIIFSNLERDTFSIVDFYNRRIRRIFPALIAVMIASLLFGWFALLADEYAQLGEHVAAGAAFLSNFALWRESGYFDNAAETKPMLHLWSLAIEEQFYILWPITLALVWRSKWNFLRITAIVGALSFSANIWLVRSNVPAAFYLPISRFWELMVGGALAYVTMHRPELLRARKNLQSLVGFAMLAMGLITINAGKHFPGYWALLPTVGAFFVISGGSKAWLNKYLLSNRLMVWIGVISYPLYLWHWPLLSFANIIESDVGREVRVAAIIVATLLAWLTNLYIERPIRFGGLGRGKVIGLLLLMLIVGAAAYACWKLKGLEGYGFRVGERTSFARYFENDLPDWNYFEREKILEKLNSECDFYDLASYRIGQATRIPVPSIPDTCYRRKPQYSRAVFIWGDSHAQQLVYGLKQQLPPNWQVLQVTSSSCNPKLNAAPSASDYCEQSNWLAYRTIIDSSPDVVIVGQNSQHSAQQMMDMADEMERIGVKKVLFTGPSPHWTKDLPKIVLRHLWKDTPRRTFIGIDRAVMRRNEELKAHFRSTGRAKFVSIIDNFCTDEGCFVFLGDDKKTGITSWDYGHLTPLASNDLAKNMLVPLITEGVE